MQRKKFLIATVSGLAVLANTQHVFARALAQPPLSGLPGKDGRCLVLINLQGGNDGLNCVVPYADRRYYELRPTLAIPPNEVLRIDERLGFNPAMRSLKTLYDKGMVAIVQGVGYPNASYSHFRSTEIWQTAAPDRYEHTGWLGRYFDGIESPSRLFEGVAISLALPEVLAAERTDIPAIADPDRYGLALDRNPLLRRDFSADARDARLPFDSPYEARVLEIEEDAQRGARELPSLIAGYRSQATYPATPLGCGLALAAQIIGGSAQTKVVYVEQSGFDTHANQRAAQDRRLEEFSSAVAAFYRDLAAHGSDGRVLTLTFSEFGRRIAENGGRGTDHGEASPLFLIGGAVRGGVYGEPPDLSSGASELGNLRYTTDFRSVYATVLERWLGRPSAPVLQGSFPALAVLAERFSKR
jgi:uncharacterized protein (DUF1501 family)